MKRLLTSLAVLLSSLLTTFAQYSGSGNGTEEDPYLIFNENQLSQMVNFLNQEGVVFKLMKDLDLTNWIAENNPSQGWVPVGVESSPFKGKFLGNNHKISGFSIKRSTEGNVGFFGYLNGAIIQDITIEGSVVSGKNYVGGIAGQSVSSTISNVNITLTGATGITGQENVGGFVGNISSSAISSCSATIGGTGVTGSKNVGGFAGKVTNGTFNDFNAYTAVNATSLAGGVIGTISGGTYQNGYAEGNIIVTQGSAGGFAGMGNSYEITDIKVVGNIQCAASGCAVGGMVATSEGTAELTNCTIIGNLSAQENGGIGAGALGGTIGFIKGGSSVTLNTCFSKGRLNHTGDYTGGIIGKSEGACIANMESCSHFGDISGKDYVGGLIGAMLSADVQPTLSTYTVYSDRSGNSPSGTLIQMTKETIVNGTAVTASINNCTAIGNIDGESWVGGLIGSDLSSYGYSPNAKTATCSNSNYNYKYLFKDGVYTGTYTYSGSKISYTYYDYARNSVSHSLTNNYYSGTIHGTNHVGGLVGLKGGGELRNNYAYANIYGDANVGGIVGSTTAQTTLSSYSVTTIKSNVANCQTISATTSDLGRVYGSIAGTSYTTIGALGSAEGNRGLAQTKLILQGVVQDIEDNQQQGTSIGPSLLRLKATYVSMGWNFDENWDILETECYPYKKYQAAPPVIESELVSKATTISGKSLNGGTVYLYYKDRDAVSTECDGYQWTFNTEALQSGALVQIYADVEGMTPSYFSATNVGYPGSGTEDDPWRIYTAEDLQGACNRGYYKLMNDIDLTQWISENSPTKGWISVGRNSGEATYIDGDGHKVTGLWIDAPNEDFTGLFSNFSAGQIKNLNVEVATGKKVRGADYTGILIGRNANGRLVNCSVKGQVEGTMHVGGVVGYAEATAISSITFDGAVTSTANETFAGGLAGQIFNCSVTTCNAAPTIEATGSTSKVGGLAGQAVGGSISKSTSANTVTASGNGSYVGGLIGYSETPVTQCIATGRVTTTGADSYTGGLVGYTLAAVENSYSTATTTGTWFTGGLVGYTFNSIDKCYAKGDVYGSNYGGGVVGELDGPHATLTNSVACNNILSLSAQSSWGSRVIGGYKNGAADPNESNFALNTMQVSLNNVPQTKTDDIVEGQARTAQQLMQAATYQGLGWNLSEVWGIDEGQMFPYLLWEIDINPVADVSFDKTTLLIAVGKSETVSASVLPLGATNKRLVWTSSNTAVATVADGVVTAIAVGTATITATSTDGSNISATCQVTVTANHDAAITELQSIVARAQSLYDNSTEGGNIGEYATGARAELLTVINSVNGRISSTMSDEAITQCTNEINTAIELFQSKKITAGEDTDIATLENTVYIERVEAAPGNQITLSVKMKNLVEAESFGFDLYLPNGVTVACDEDNFPIASLSTERTTINKTNHFNADFKQDGSLNIQAYSSRGYTISGNDGEVALITINVSNDIEANEYPIIIRNIAIADKNSVTYRVDYVKSTLAVSSYTLGDANSDSFVDVGDLTAISHYILERPDASFNAKAADANADNNIDVGDLTAVSHLILWGSIQRPNASRSMSIQQILPKKTRSVVVTDISDIDNVIYVEPFTAPANSTYTMSVKMKNNVVAEGFGFDLVLPEGITVATDNDGFALAYLSEERTTSKKTNNFNADFKLDGTLNIQAYSTNGSSISGNDGEIATIVLNIGANVPQDTYPIFIRNIAVSDVNAASHRTDEVQTAVTVTEPANYDMLLDETSTTAPTEATGVDVKVKRTINANEWSTICLPFAMSATQVRAAFGDDVQLADFTGYVFNEPQETITLNFSTVTAIEANHPYVIKVTSAISEFTVDNVDIAPVEEPMVNKGTSRKPKAIVGTYVANTTIGNGCLFLSNNKFLYSLGTTKMKAFRAYFDFIDLLPDFEENYAETRIQMAFDDETANVVELKDGRLEELKSCYNLKGQRVEKPTKKGIYIRNAKKVIIK